MRAAVLRSIAATVVAAALALSASAASIASASTSQPAKSGGTLQVEAVASQWPGLDSATDTQDTADAAYLNEIYGQLFEMTANNVVIPDQATSWKLTNHNSTLTFTLRKGLVFSNGDPMTAADVVIGEWVWAALKSTLSGAAMLTAMYLLGIVHGLRPFHDGSHQPRVIEFLHRPRIEHPDRIAARDNQHGR